MKTHLPGVSLPGLIVATLSYLLGSLPSLEYDPAAWFLPAKDCPQLLTWCPLAGGAMDNYTWTLFRQEAGKEVRKQLANWKGSTEQTKINTFWLLRKKG